MVCRFADKYCKQTWIGERFVDTICKQTYIVIGIADM